MINAPKTVEEARKLVYGKWAGSRGHGYISSRCAFEVWPNERAPVPYQCQKKNGHGPEKLYCKTHSEKLGYSDGVTKMFLVDYRGYRDKIRKVEVMAVKDVMVVYKEKWGVTKERKDMFFERFEDAKAALMIFADREVKNAEAEWQRAKTFKQKVNNMSETSV
jgi:hypothetical protein